MVSTNVGPATRARLTVVVVVSLALAGCDRAESKASTAASTAPAASALASSKLPASAHALDYVIAAKGTTTVDMPGPKEHIKAETSVAAGSLQIDLRDLALSRGEVKIDLTSLTTHTFGDREKDETQTTHARTWLEAVVDGKVREEHRWAVLAIRSIDGSSASDVTKVAPTQSSGMDARGVSLMVHGEVLVHGHKVNKDVSVELTFLYPAGAAADSKPTSVRIKTKAPMRIVLADHDITPRDPVGTVLQWTSNLIGKVADAADVSVDLSAAPVP